MKPYRRSRCRHRSRLPALMFPKPTAHKDKATYRWCCLGSDLSMRDRRSTRTRALGVCLRCDRLQLSVRQQPETAAPTDGR